MNTIDDLVKVLTSFYSMVPFTKTLDFIKSVAYLKLYIDKYIVIVNVISKKMWYLNIFDKKNEYKELFDGEEKITNEELFNNVIKELEEIVKDLKNSTVKKKLLTISKIIRLL